jgi:hypothetical protein
MELLPLQLPPLHPNNITPHKSQNHTSPMSHSHKLRGRGLPVEILDAICSHLCIYCRLGGIVGFCRSQFDHDKRRQECWMRSQESPRTIQIRQERATLASLCRTSRNLRSIATPYLYHVCSTTQGFNYRGIDEESDPTFQLVASCMRTVRSRPELASHIRYMDMPFHGVFIFP